MPPPPLTPTPSAEFLIHDSHFFMFVQNSQTDHLMPMFPSERAQSERKSRILIEKGAALHVRNTVCLLNKEISK